MCWIHIEVATAAHVEHLLPRSPSVLTAACSPILLESDEDTYWSVQNQKKTFRFCWFKKKKRKWSEMVPNQSSVFICFALFWKSGACLLSWKHLLGLLADVAFVRAFHDLFPRLRINSDGCACAAASPWGCSLPRPNNSRVGSILGKRKNPQE